MAVLDTKKIGLGKLPQILPDQLLKIGNELVQRIKTDARRGVSQDDSTPTFAQYSNWYGDFKMRGDPDEDGNATNSQVDPPNLTYTGKMLSKIYAKKPRKDGFTIQYVEGERVLENIRMSNRNIYDLNSKNMDWLASEVVKIFDANSKKLKNTKIKIGK